MFIELPGEALEVGKLAAMKPSEAIGTLYPKFKPSPAFRSYLQLKEVRYFAALTPMFASGIPTAPTTVVIAPSDLDNLVEHPTLVASAASA